MNLRTLGLGALICAFAITLLEARASTLNQTQKKDAAAALDQRIGCAAFYRLTFDLLTGPRANEHSRAMAGQYDDAGKNLLVQATALASAIGESRDATTNKFKTALSALRERVAGRSIIYNDLARRLHPVCEPLIQR